uniref:HAT C-terminal dimerisation domain-containing protein n=1 Tax=Neogobius melanostomus TaxID=47308 RepID=A0A8C6WVX2_9GOBI
MLPISTVQSPTSDRKTFVNYLENLEYISTTADIWTCHNKSFMGMTAHSINPNNLKREKVAIACRRIKGCHTYNVVAREIERIHSAFGLTHKVTAIVTDNGSNFAKAFRIYEAATASSESEEDGGEEEEDNIVFADLNDILSNGTAEGDYILPPHLRCPQSLLRINAKKKLIVPFHDALTCILTIPIPRLCAQLDIRVLSEREHKFLTEYCSVMKPLTVALDILQGEDNCCYGCLLPTLEVLMSKMLALQPGLSRMTAGLLDVIAIKTRFGSVLENKDAQLAAVKLPKFKLRWLKEEQRKDSLKTLLITECRSSIDTQEVNPSDSELQASFSSNKGEMDFCAFEDDLPASRNCESEVLSHFQSGCEIDILHQFPNIKALFLKLNTATPSSAPERLFSLGSLGLTTRRNRLSDNYCYSGTTITLKTNIRVSLI